MSKRPVIIRRHWFEDGEATLLGTIELMKKLAIEDTQYSTIKKISDRLWKKSQSQAEYARRAHDYVVQEIEYVPDVFDGVDKEKVTAPRHTLAGDIKEGDCDCMVAALACLLLLQDIPVKIKIVAWRPEYKDDYTHVYVVFYLEESDVWVPADPTAGRDGFGYQVSPRYKEEYFDV